MTSYKIIILLLLLVFISRCRPNADITEDQLVLAEEQVSDNEFITVTNDQFLSSGYALGGITQHEFTRDLRVFGNVHLPAKNMATVSTLMPGTVGSFSVIEGQWVSKGQVLFKLTNPELLDIQQQFLELKDKLAYNQSEYDRVKDLANDQIITQKEFSKIQAELNLNKTTLNILEQKLLLFGIKTTELSSKNLKDHIEIQAPISGYITKISTTQGSYIDATTAAMKIAGTHHMHLELFVLESEASYLRKNQKVLVKIPGGVEIEAEIYLINPTLNDDKTIGVHCHILEKDRKYLIPGMTVQGKLTLDHYETSALPAEAVVKRNGQNSILVFSHEAKATKFFLPHSVSIGQTSEAFVEIKNPDDFANKSILTAGAYYLVK